MQLSSVFHVTPTKNLERICVEGIIPQIGDRSNKMETEPGVYAFTSRLIMEEAMANWFGEEFDENEPLVCIEIKANDLAFELDPAVGFEVISRKTISPFYFSKIRHL